ncbi:MAG TPA: FAD-dependent oxidoreductase [Kaistella sp.]|jgi:glycine/D-amino acid oxidase-like deaminating enzyme|nr:FAD-dependent oxidoreductase [Kaistella sp.]
MRNVDYIIVGGGYAGLFFAHQLIMNNKSFVIFSEGRKSASQVSAGIINPVVLKKFTTFWLAEEQIDLLKKTLSEIENYTGQNYLIQENIHRIFHDEKEKELWLKKAEHQDLKLFLNKYFKDLDTVKNMFQSGVVNESARLNVADFFSDFNEYLTENNLLIQGRFHYSELQLNSYKEFQFNKIVFCDGMGVKENPFFSEIPVVPNKGHHLKVKLSRPLPFQFTVKKKHFLFPLKNNSYYYGGTYDRDELHHKIDDSAKEQLINALCEFYPHDFEVEEIEFGFRPTVKDRRPIIGRHPKHENFYVFNGLGARGILNGCYFSRELYEHIENGKPLHAEVDLKRFQK